MSERILYLHGYKGSLTPEKRTILEHYSNVVAPTIDYDNPGFFKKLLPFAQKADVFIGSSFGGYTAHMLSMLYNKPALLFNPAFVTKSPVPDLDGLTMPEAKSSHTCIVLGKLDDVIIYRDNLEHVSRNLGLDDVRIVEEEDMGHRIPEDVFGVQVEGLWKRIYTNQ